MAIIGTGRYQREEPPKINLDWVKVNCKLTEREEGLLHILKDRMLVRRDHLQIISEPYRKLGDSGTRLLNRSLKRMYLNLCVDKFNEPQRYGEGRSPDIYALDRAGSIILGETHRRRIIHEKGEQRGKPIIHRRLPTNFRHINGVNQMEVDTILFCESRGIEIITWEHERIRPFTYGLEKINVIPDVFMELKLKNKNLFAYLEYDTGSEDYRGKNNFPTLHEKLIKYKKYKSSKLWMDYSNYFPVILFVTEDDKRMPFVNKRMREYGLEGLAIYSEKYQTILEHLSR